MKLVALPVTLFLTLCLVASVLLNFSFVVLLYLLFNLILVIRFLSYKPPKDELDGLWPPLLSSCEDAYVKDYEGENAESSCEVAGDTYVNIKGDQNHNNQKVKDIDDDDEKHSCSDGCKEDDDNNIIACEIGWQDDDENLEKRIEEFIAKVNKGWREEMLRDQ